MRRELIIDILRRVVLAAGSAYVVYGAGKLYLASVRMQEFAATRGPSGGFNNAELAFMNGVEMNVFLMVVGAVLVGLALPSYRGGSKA